MLDSPWTNFYTNRSYTTHEIDPARLKPGNHTLGLRVGQGFCTSKGQDMYDADAERSAILQLQLHPGGGGDAVTRVVTDTSWSCSAGPITSDSTYYGESYDARLETKGWAEPGFSPEVGGHPWGSASTNFTGECGDHLLVALRALLCSAG